MKMLYSGLNREYPNICTERENYDFEFLETRTKSGITTLWSFIVIDTGLAL